MKVQKSYLGYILEQGHYVPSELLGPDLMEPGKSKDNGGIRTTNHRRFKPEIERFLTIAANKDKSLMHYSQTLNSSA